MIETVVNVDLVRKGTYPIVGAVQSDQYSRNIKANLFSNGIPWVPADGTTAVVSYKKVDGKVGRYDTLPNGETAWSIDGNSVVVAIAPQVCTVAGPVELVIGLIKGESYIHTFMIYIDVQPNPGATSESEDYFNVTVFVPSSGWGVNKYLGTDENGNVVEKEATGATVEDVLNAIPTTTHIDFSNFSNGTWTETVNGEEVSHTVTFDTDGRPVTIDGVSITWGDA